MGMVFALSAAAQDVDVKINFQRNLDREAPDGYLIDAGEEFGDRDNGYEYGWNFDHSGLARDNNQANEDRRLATHTHFNEEGYWTINLPNGTYEVTTSIGDSAYPTGDKGKLILLANDTVLFEDAEAEQIGAQEFDRSTVAAKGTAGTMALSGGDPAHR